MITKDICVVRLITTYWHDCKGAYLRKNLNILKKKSSGYNILTEECDNIGAAEVLPEITNLYEVPDGVYEVVICNVSKDSVTGYVDDYYDYKLKEYKE